MNPAHLLVLSALCVSLLGAANIPPQPLNLLQFNEMIECTIPGSFPLLDYMDYGCYCGTGGRGTPVDMLDRCCKEHDDCYAQIKENPKCSSLLNVPYVKQYSFTCSEGDLTCSDAAGTCARIVCDCDRTAALCFAEAPYKRRNFKIDYKTRCQ